MRLVVVSASPDDRSLLEAALALALDKLGADEVIYLGDDDAILHVETAPSTGVRAYVSRIAELSVEGTPEQIQAFCKQEPPRLALRRLPSPPAHAIELLDDQLVLLVRDLSALDDEDRENASIIVHPAGALPSLVRQGRAYTFTPGALAKGGGGVGLLASDGGGFVAEAYDPMGTRVLGERLDLRAEPTLHVAGKD